MRSLLVLVGLLGLGRQEVVGRNHTICEYYDHSFCESENQCNITVKACNDEKEVDQGRPTFCYALWENVSNVYKLHRKGCWMNTGACQMKKDCVHKATHVSTSHFFCCCEGDYCNANYTFIPVPPPTPKPTGAAPLTTPQVNPDKPDQPVGDSTAKSGGPDTRPAPPAKMYPRPNLPSMVPRKHSSEGKASKIGMTVGVCVGVILLLAAVSAGVIYWKKQKFAANAGGFDNAVYMKSDDTVNIQGNFLMRGIMIQGFRLM